MLGLLHIMNIQAHLRWQKSSLRDPNAALWRERGFSLAPDVLCEAPGARHPVDTWAPLALGLFAVLIHTHETIICNFRRFVIFNVLLNLFGVMGYEGAVGLMCSVPVWLCLLFAVPCAVFAEGNPSLELLKKFKACDGSIQHRNTQIVVGSHVEVEAKTESLGSKSRRRFLTAASE
ncbi:MAG: uncharacterized protein KVP18_000294 [Porospora cf. gigantea A]|uniref:uncharacterized protein n=1 Tax=Porospora cf. gigantea A TaxID=2853593 RepID=UPI00355AAD81|nr:MAG: hypothetical protein KVP18_000294 [Porospora cf. gigantea A]